MLKRENWEVVLSALLSLQPYRIGKAVVDTCGEFDFENAILNLSQLFCYFTNYYTFIDTQLGRCRLELYTDGQDSPSRPLLDLELTTLCIDSNSSMTYKSVTEVCITLIGFECDDVGWAQRWNTLEDHFIQLRPVPLLRIVHNNHRGLLRSILEGTALSRMTGGGHLTMQLKKDGPEASKEEVLSCSVPGIYLDKELGAKCTLVERFYSVLDAKDPKSAKRRAQQNMYSSW